LQPTDNKKNWEIKVSPNPVMGITQFFSNNIQTVKIYNSLGVLQKEMKLSEGKNDIDFNEFSKGLYFVKNELGQTYKILKE
jgi:hypothetical protein